MIRRSLGILSLIFLAIYSIFLALSFVIFGQSPKITYSDIYQPTTSIVTSTPTPQPIRLNADKLWSLVQNWRQSQNLQIYTKDQLTCDIANDRIKDWVIQDDNHTGFIKKYSNKYPFELAENAGTGNSEQSKLAGWLNSPKHAEILHQPYPRSCIACQGIWCVQIFANY